MNGPTRRQICALLGAGAVGAALPRCAGIEWAEPALGDTGGAVEDAQITVRPSEARGEVSPLLFGSSLEWTDHGSYVFDPQRNRVRPEVIELLRPLRIPVFRFPGGIMADHYQWRDAVGPQAQRPKGRNPMDGTEHANTFGTDEFIEFLEALSAEPLVTANVGSGTYEELADWRQYFEKAGRKVHWWELGNEIYLAEPRRRASIPGNDDRIYHTAGEYAEKAAEWARRLKAADPSVLAGGIAGTYNTSPENRGWLDVLLSTAAPALDFVALHNAFAPLVRGSYDYRNPQRRNAAYLAMFAQVEHSVEDTREVMRRWREATGGKPARVAITEHFPLFGFGGGQQQLLRILDQSRTLASALFTASLFHAWMREGVWLATYNLTVSKWFGALLTDTEDGLVRTPTYHVFDLYRNRFGSRLVDASVSGPTFSASAVGSVAARERVGYLDAVASRDAAGAVTLAVVCRRQAGSVPGRIQGLPPGRIEVTTLSDEVPNAINGPALTDTVQAQSAVQPRTSTWTFEQGQSYTFPPNSVSILRWPTA